MTDTMKEVLQFVRENDIKFIRLAFCDIFGTQKNISIMPDELERAFQYGISFDASAISGFMNVEKSDLFLYPDPATLNVLPWRPQQGRVIRFFCDIRHPDGKGFEGDMRNLLKQAENPAIGMGYICKIGAECEFYLFHSDDDGNPMDVPYDNGGYLDISPLDRCENVRREICLTLEQMGIKPESSHHEQGPGQNEIDFKYSDALSAADNLITFKSVVKAIAEKNGLFASFLPKPIINKSGSGLHINLSITKVSNLSGGPASVSESFLAGILERAVEITAFTNPIPNSYTRLGVFEAPRYVSWSHENRSQLVRIPATTSDEYRRIELRSPDPSCNPYLTFTLLIHAGLDGIERGLVPLKPVDFNMYTADSDILEKLPSLPSDLKEALDIAVQSEFIRRILPKKTFEKYRDIKLAEWDAYRDSPDKEKIDKQIYFRYI